MPISSPCVLTSAPPELPTLIAASVWMKFSNTATPKLGTTGGADDAVRHRLGQSQRIADRQHDVADLHLVRAAQAS